MRGVVICDGRGNAGTGACAAVAYIQDIEVARRAIKLEPVTNIVAELKAIDLALVLSVENQINDVLIRNDSQTPIYLVNGSYKIRKPHLLPLVHEIWRKARDPFFISTQIEWVPREQTLLADRLCRLVDPNSKSHKLEPLVRKEPTSRGNRNKLKRLKNQERPNPFLGE